MSLQQITREEKENEQEDTLARVCDTHSLLYDPDENCPKCIENELLNS
ncbi:hypothetical protein ACFQGE_10270 [Halomicroarcula sp. GCM10025817]|nr:hypothetical protein [Halomicroarcula sp. SYNS111]